MAINKKELRDALEADLFPTLTEPVQVIAPDIPYEKALVWLSVGPRLDRPGVVDATASITIKPYRMVNGVIDIAPDVATRYVTIGSAFEAVEADPKLAEAILGIAQILQAALA